MLRGTFAVWSACSWHAAQVWGETRKSPGFIKRTNSRLSSAISVFDLSGLRLEHSPFLQPHSFGNLGWTWASLCVVAAGLPPWQAVQVRPWASLPASSSVSRAVAHEYLCIGSILLWHLRQPSTESAAFMATGSGATGCGTTSAF